MKSRPPPARCAGRGRHRPSGASRRLRVSGFAVELAVHAFSAIGSYIYGFGRQQLNVAAGEGATEESAEAILSAIPADEFPGLAEVITDFMLNVGYDESADFDFGLGLILCGLPVSIPRMNAAWPDERAPGGPVSPAARVTGLIADRGYPLRVNEENPEPAEAPEPAPDPTPAAPAPDPEPAPDPAPEPEPEPAPAPAQAPEPEPDPEPVGFAALDLDERLLRTLTGLGYEEPTPVQEVAIPPLLAGRDLLAEAPTGTGKTAAFALPILQHLARRMDEARAAGRPVDGRGVPRDGRGSRPSSLVLAPTRELAMQVAEAIHRYGRDLGVRVIPIYGGQPITTQLARLARGVDVVVATPGRAVDHLDRGTLRFDEVQTVVLDEADEMLDMGFADDLDKILGALRKDRQTALFSATIAGQIARLAERHLNDPVRVRVHETPQAKGEDARVRQVAYVVRRADKLAALGRILDLEDGAATLVFARTRGEVDDLAEALSGRGRDAAALHGGLSQEQRDRIMGRFRDGALDVLVATDVAARGLDIGHISHVVNYDVPSSTDVYVHRIGRTGRAGREGVAVTLVEPREHRLLRDIERAVGQPLEIAGLPTISDVREHRMDALRAQLREALVAGDFDRYRAVVEPLSGEFDLVDIALAAISQADAEARGAEDTAELAQATLPSFDRPGARGPARRPFNQDRGYGQARPGPRGPYNAPPRYPQQQGQYPQQGYQQQPNRDPRFRPGPPGPGLGAPPPFGADQGQYPQQGQSQGQDQQDQQRPDQGRPYEPRPGRDRPMRPGEHAGPRRGFRLSGWHDPEGRPVMRAPNMGSGGGGITRLFVGAGRAAGMRPGDLVGAITNEAGLRGGDIGAIQIADGFSLVEVPEAAADHVIRALRAATIKGQKVNVRRERF